MNTSSKSAPGLSGKTLFITGASRGIGLAIARRVAQVHGGTLEYTDRVGGGAVFTLSLPVKRYSGGSV